MPRGHPDTVEREYFAQRSLDRRASRINDATSALTVLRMVEQALPSNKTKAILPVEAAVYRIDSIDDPSIVAYRNLRDRTLRGEGIFVAEGRLLVERLLHSDFATESVLVVESLAKEFARIVPATVPLYVAGEALLREIVGFHFHRGALAAGRRHAPPTMTDLLDRLAVHPKASLVVLPEVTKPENLGLIVRSAAALGIDGVLLGERCCDPLSRRALRLSMGSVLQVPTARSIDLAADLVLLKQQFGYALIATVLDPAAEPLPGVRWPGRTALLFGNEFDGLGAPWLAQCDRQVTIPMQPGVDSLNLGVAAGVVLYELQRSRDGRQRDGAR